MRASMNNANAGTPIAEPTTCHGVHGCTHGCRKARTPTKSTATATVLMFSFNRPPVTRLLLALLRYGRIDDAYKQSAGTPMAALTHHKRPIRVSPYLA